MSYQRQREAIEFRQVMGQPLNVYNRDIMRMQKELIREEYDELFQALYLAADDLQNRRARVDALKELADLVYVCYQLAAAVGWNLDEALRRVHVSNMSKLVDGKPVRREDGKVLKGPNYRQPNLLDLVL